MKVEVDPKSQACFLFVKCFSRFNFEDFFFIVYKSLSPNEQNLGDGSELVQFESATLLYSFNFCKNNLLLCDCE